MAAPIYFFAGLTRDKLVHQDKLIRSTLERYGLLDQFGDVRSVEREVAAWDHPGAGPDGKSSGTMLRAYTRLPDGAMAPGQRQGYFPQLQSWSQALDANDTQLWIGIDKDEPPGPSDLQRRKLIRGFGLELGDGREWHVPFVRRPPLSDDEWSATNLPSVFQWNTNGKVVAVVKEQYRQIWEDTEDVQRWLDSGGFTDVPAKLSLCVRVIGLNYRFGRYEQQVMGLIDTENFLSVLAWSIAWPLVEAVAVQKKSQEDLASSTELEAITSSGQPVETPDTAPAVAS